MRYKNTPIIKNKDNTRIYESIIYPTIASDASDIYIRVRYGDRLDKFANTYYHDTSLWWIIAQANHLQSIFITPGARIRIPQKIK